MQALFIGSARHHMHNLLVEGSLYSPLPRMAVEHPLSFINSINGHLQDMTPENLCLNHWPYLILLSLLKHPYWRRHCQFGARIPCHALALPLVLVSMLFDRFFVILNTLLQVMTELSAYSLDPSGIVVYREPQDRLSQNEISSSLQYISVLHSQSDHPQISNILIQLLIISTALGT